MYSRFFAFGCSFTSYYWPTWADIIGQEFSDRYYNLAMCGAGNEFMFHFPLTEENEVDEYMDLDEITGKIFNEE